MVKKYYGSFQYFPFINLSYDHLILLIYFFIIPFVFLHRPETYNPKERLIVLNLLCASIVYFLQEKFYPYHVSVVEHLLVFFLIIYSLVHSFRKRTLLIPIVLSFFYMNGYGEYFLHPPGKFLSSPSTCINETLPIITRYSKEEDKILILSSSVRIDYPLLNLTKREIGSRYLFNYPISFLGSVRFKNHHLNLNKIDKEHEQFELEYKNNLMTDIKNKQPKIIFFVEKTDNPHMRQNMPYGFPLSKYLYFLGILDFIKKNDYVFLEKTPCGAQFYIRRSFEK